MVYYIIWRDGRVVDCTGLENRRSARARGFESLSLRIYNKFQKSLLYLIRFCYVFVFTKGSDRNNYQMKCCSHFFELNLVCLQHRIRTL